MEPPDAGDLGIDKRVCNIGLDLVKPTRQSRNATLALGEIAGSDIEQRKLQTIMRQFGGDLLGRAIEGREKFDGGKAFCCRRIETIEEAPFLKHEAQIGSKFGHEIIEPSGCIDPRSYNDRCFSGKFTVHPCLPSRWSRVAIFSALF